MKVNQTTNICPGLKPVQLPLVGKCVSINSATRIFCRKAMMTGISSVRSWVMVICSLIPRAYLNSYFLAKIRTNCEEQGTAYQDIWVYQSYTQGYYYGDPQNCIDQDVAPLGPTSGERLGYQTQKPEGLLDRIIRSSCPNEGIVLDPFCGCGTAIHAAQKLGKQW